MTTATPATQTVVRANQTPRISDIVPGAVIYRLATVYTRRIVSELPCHSDQMVSIDYDSGSTIKVDQQVVCRRCFAAYSATPVPATDDYAWYRIAYRVLGRVAMSRPKRVGE